MFNDFTMGCVCIHTYITTTDLIQNTSISLTLAVKHVLSTLAVE